MTKTMLFLSIVILLSGCSTIRLGGAEFVKRYDKDGNEVAYVVAVDRPAGVDGKDVNLGSNRVGLAAGHVFGTPGLIVGSLVGGAIGAVGSALSNDGKIRIKYTDYDLAHERNTRAMMPLEQIDRKAWIMSGQLQQGAWARIDRRKGDIYLMPCDPACPANPDPTVFPPTGQSSSSAQSGQGTTTAGGQPTQSLLVQTSEPN